MSKQAIYMMNGRGADPAIERGLKEAGCEVIAAHSIVETLTHLKQAGVRLGNEPALQKEPASPIILVAEVQAGAIPLLTLLHERGTDLPPTLLYDRDGSDIRVAIKALQLGVKDYLLGTDSEVNREVYACVLAQRQGNHLRCPTDVVARYVTKTNLPGVIRQAPQPRMDIVWDATMHEVRVGQETMRLSPIEARIFDLLYARRGQIVTVKDFLTSALKKPAMNPRVGARQLRPHLMRLRRKLDRFAPVANHIVNTRGSGYMLVE